MKTLMSFQNLVVFILFTLNPFVAFSGPGGTSGGGAILCDQNPPELTDFWEASMKSPSSKLKMDQLRKMNENQAVNFFADRLVQYYDSGKRDEARATIIRFLNATRAALYSPQVEQIFSFNGDPDGSMMVSVRVDDSVANPNDSGVIFGLSESGNCHEERVAVSKYMMNDAVHSTKSKLQLIIRRPDVFQAMAPIDQVGLILSHEIYQAFSRGRVDIAQLESSNKKDSAEVRLINAWMILSSDNDNAALRSYRPEQAQKIYCSAVSPNSQREGYYADRVNFNLFIEAEKTLMEIEIYKDENVLYPSFARFHLPREAFRLPPGLNLNVGPSDIGASFDFRMNSLGSNPLQALISRKVPHMNSAMQEESTEHRASIEIAADGKVNLSIDNLRTKSNEFRGQILCYSLSKTKK